ncbi:hypothetical protein C8R44DRAFT_882571 [Mycena epipterygia]|nr:hypothetical protein C8R44DRAFT_882571 [Mycena epipterygia]
MPPSRFLGSYYPGKRRSGPQMRAEMRRRAPYIHPWGVDASARSRKDGWAARGRHKGTGQRLGILAPWYHGLRGEASCAVRLWEIQMGDGNSSVLYGIWDTPPGIVVTASIVVDKSVLLYSTIPIVDFDNQLGLAASASSKPWLTNPDQLGRAKMLAEWALGYPKLPATSISSGGYSTQDLYLIQKLNLLPTDAGPPRANVTLHELENALSVLIASMFWTFAPLSINVSEVNGSLVRYPYSRQNTPFRLNGTATITALVLEGCLDLNIIAVAAGLTASIVLLLLSLPNSFLHRGSCTPFGYIATNYPELETLLEQVEHSTDDNLRDAGMVHMRLVGDGPRKRESGDCELY